MSDTLRAPSLVREKRTRPEDVELAFCLLTEINALANVASTSSDPEVRRIMQHFLSGLRGGAPTYLAQEGHMNVSYEGLPDEFMKLIAKIVIEGNEFSLRPRELAERINSRKRLHVMVPNELQTSDKYDSRKTERGLINVYEQLNATSNTQDLQNALKGLKSIIDYMQKYRAPLERKRYDVVRLVCQYITAQVLEFYYSPTFSELKMRIGIQSKEA